MTESQLEAAEATPRPAARGDAINQAGELRSARIESLRAIAALGVLVGHVFGAAYAYQPVVYRGYLHRVLFGGGFGVFLFFALSGYLLYWPFAKRDFGGGDHVDLGRYARNRALRILPLYYFVVVVLLIVHEDGGTLGQWWRFLTFSENFSTYTIAKVDGVIWSLVVELHFYLLLPLVAWGATRLSHGSRTRAATLLAALGLASLATYYVTVSHSAHPSLLWRYSLPTTFFYFATGMLVALLRTAWSERRPAWLNGPLGAADLWLVASVPLWGIVFWRYSLGPLTAVAAAIVVAACVLPLRPGRLVRALSWRPLATLGVASYSLYLWHLPLIDLVTGGSGDARDLGLPLLFVIVVPLACAVALVSYRLVEAPFLSLRERWSDASAAQQNGHRRSRAATA